jgi:hypothetical protein
LIVNPSPDVYGADLQMLQTARALLDHGHRVVVVLPEDGDLAPRIKALGAEVRFTAFPVLRKSHASATGLLTMSTQAAVAIPRAVRLLRVLRPSLLLVNTVTLPWWLLAGRLAGVPTIGYLHEAEKEARPLVRRALVAPLRLAHAVIVISRVALSSMLEVEPTLGDRAHLIYNGVPEPTSPPQSAARRPPFRFVVVGRLSPRKAPDVALEAVALLRDEGFDVELEIAGSTFPGYEWYEAELRARAARPDLSGRVLFSGYCSPIWPVLGRCDVLVATSLHEPFGNAVVEAQLARRPVVAAASAGHLESVVDDLSGLLVTPGDPRATAAAMRRLLLDPALAERLAAKGQSEALRRFGVSRYQREIVELVDRVTHDVNQGRGPVARWRRLGLGL